MWIKICGIRDVATAQAVAACGADAIGLNFCEQSPRRVDVQTAAKIVDALPPEVTPVGVFVNHTADDIREHCRRTGITTVQLHGDEPASLIRDLQSKTELRETLSTAEKKTSDVDFGKGSPKGLRVIRAMRTDGDFHQLVRRHMREYDDLAAFPWAWLVDARVPNVYGGSGRTVDWKSIAAAAPDVRSPPLILAGGLEPENISRAIRTVRPWGVDVASGVEDLPGVKNVVLVETFIEQARSSS